MEAPHLGGLTTNKVHAIPLRSAWLVVWTIFEYIHVLYDKAISFVKFTLRSSAEFAKEAMTDQSLDSDEVLGIRWANEDPNPQEKEKEDAKSHQELAETIAKKKEAEDPYYEYANQISDHFPSQYDTTAYPQTDEQYQTLPHQEPSYVQNSTTYEGNSSYSYSYPQYYLYNSEYTGDQPTTTTDQSQYGGYENGGSDAQGGYQVENGQKKSGNKSGLVEDYNSGEE